MSKTSIFNLQTDLKGNKKEIWMIHDAESFGVWFEQQPVPDRIRIENVTVRDMQGGSMTPIQGKSLSKWGTLPGVEITMHDMYQQWLDIIQRHARTVSSSGELAAAVRAERLSASDACALIEAAEGTTPQSILELL